MTETTKRIRAAGGKAERKPENTTNMSNTTNTNNNVHKRKHMPANKHMSVNMEIHRQYRSGCPCNKYIDQKQ